MTHVHLNGAAVRLPDGATLRDLVPDTEGVAVAVDDVVVPRTEHATRVLRDGERVEVVTAVQGG